MQAEVRHHRHGDEVDAEVRREDREDPVAVDDVAVAVDREHPVAVAVERDAEIEPVLDDRSAAARAGRSRRSPC